jgi:hypothetical protein
MFFGDTLVVFSGKHSRTKMIQHSNHQPESTEANDRDRTQKIQSLRDMINNAERTIQGAKAMLLQLEGKKKLGRKRKVEEVTDGTVVEGTFDGQIMLGTDGKQYPVPANYASKSKLVEGDMLKLTITPDGSFIYKQIGPVERRHALGIVGQDESGNYYVLADGRPHKVLLASITYFKAEPGDEVAVVLPRDLEANWAAIENVIQKGGGMGWSAPRPQSQPPAPAAPSSPESWKEDLREERPAATEEPVSSTPLPDTPHKSAEELRQEIIDEWTKDLEEIEREMSRNEQDGTKAE